MLVDEFDFKKGEFKFTDSDRSLTTIVKRELKPVKNKSKFVFEERVKFFKGVQTHYESIAEYSELQQLGISNIATHCETIQLGGGNLVNYSESKQVGLLNFAFDSFAIQVGLICYANRSTGMQFGLLTVRGDGPWYTRVTPFFYMRLKELGSVKRAKPSNYIKQN